MNPSIDTPAAIADLITQVREAAASQTPLRIIGQGTRSFLGDAGPGRPLSTLALQGITDYRPTELYITARAGTSLAEIEATLQTKGQHFAFEPPRFALPRPGGGTLGGMIATGLSGPARMAGGSLRDALLGAALLDGHAQVLHFGGKVIKNVAGYDVTRLLAGSMGTLGVILEATLRVAPLPPAVATRRFEMPQAQAIEQVNRWLAQGHPIAASAWYRGQLHVRLQGAQAAVRHSAALLGGTLLDEAEAVSFWLALRDHHHPLLRRDNPLPLWRLALPPTHPPLELGEDLLIEWHGGQRWLRSELPARTLRTAISRAGGHATLWHRGSKLGDPGGHSFTPLQGAMEQIELRIKQAFDPANIFNPGRRPYGVSG